MTIILTDEIYVTPETAIVTNGSNVEICPGDDFLYSFDCGNPSSADMTAQYLREHLPTISSLHFEHQIAIHGE